MSARVRLVRSIPYWILTVASLALLGTGVWLILDRIATMTSTLTDGSATGVEVYAGQSWIVLGAALVTAGLVGLVAALALAVMHFLLIAATMPSDVSLQPVSPIEWTAEPVVESSSHTEPISNVVTAADTHTVDENAPATVR